MLKGFFILKLINNPLAFYFLIDLDLLLLEISHFDKGIILPFFVSTALGFLLFIFFLYFKQSDHIVHNYIESFN